MKEYETVREIFNKCSNNQMRDVFVDEIACDDLDTYVANMFEGKDVSFEKSVLDDGTVIFDILTSEIRQRISFTEI